MKTAAVFENKPLKELINAPGPCITMVLAGNDAGDTRIELKDALEEITQQLRTRGVNPGSLVDALRSPDAVPTGETKKQGSVVVLRSPDMLLVERAGPGVRPVVRVADRFDLRTLLAVAGSRESFFILALSQHRIRILECTQDSSHEIPLPPGTPDSLTETMQTRKPDHVLDNRSAAGPSVGSMKGVMSGTSTDREDKDEYMLHFYMEMDKAVNLVLKGRTEPLVIVGVEHELALYRRVNTYPHLVEPGVHGAPDGLEGGDMHGRALDLLKSHTPERIRKVLADFDKQVGTGHASTHIQEIVAAAHEGRASHIFFQENSEYTGTYDGVRGRVKHTTDLLDAPVDLIEDAAFQTVLHGGEAHLLPGSFMPKGVPVCAIFRYPAKIESPPVAGAA